jgi:TolB protein
MRSRGLTASRRQVRRALQGVIVCAAVLGVAAPAQAGFPGTPGMIVFSSTFSGDREIYVAAADGSARTDLTRDPHADITPSWSADGKRIAFASDRSGAMEIYLMNAEGSGVVQLTHDAASADAPRFTADGRYVVYESKKGLNWEIRRIGTDGSGEVNLTRNRASDRYPATSPNGRLIAFSSDRGTSSRRGGIEAHIWVMNIQGHALKPVTVRKGNQFEPAWAPSGGRLAYVSGTLKAGTNLWTVLANGKGDRRLTALRGNEQVNPSWSPDGHSLAFQECPLGSSACTLSLKPLTATPVDISPLRAPLTDEFDNTDGNLWQVFQDGGTGASNTEADGKLITTFLADSTPGGAADMIGTHWGSYCRLGGDFDVQADYQLLEWPAANASRPHSPPSTRRTSGSSRSARVRPGASSTARGFLRLSSLSRRATRPGRCACSAREVPRLSPISAARPGYRSPPAQPRHRRSRSRSVRAAAWAGSVTRKSRSRGTTTASTPARSPARHSRGKTTHPTGKPHPPDDAAHHHDPTRAPVCSSGYSRSGVTATHGTRAQCRANDWSRRR